MKQIKTIIASTPETFDTQVNEALREGWELVRRDRTIASLFLAELEIDIDPTEDQTCENCQHYNVSHDEEPCISCKPHLGVWKWEAAE